MNKVGLTNVPCGSSRRSDIYVLPLKFGNHLEKVVIIENLEMIVTII